MQDFNAYQEKAEERFLRFEEQRRKEEREHEENMMRMMMMAFCPQPTHLVPPYQPYYGQTPTQMQDGNHSFQDDPSYQQDSAYY